MHPSAWTLLGLVGRRLRWLLLGAVPASLTLSLLTYICTDISPIPNLWTRIFAGYLISLGVVYGFGGNP